VLKPPKGVAVVSALALVALVAILSIGIAWLGHLSIARTQIQRDAGQAHYLSEAVEEYARWILSADLRGQSGGSAVMDHLSEPWAQPIPHSRLDLLFGAQMSADDRRRFSASAVAGGLTDEQGRMNLAAVAEELRQASPAPEGARSNAGDGADAPRAYSRLARQISATGNGQASARLIRLMELLQVSRAGQDALFDWVGQAMLTPLGQGETRWRLLHQTLERMPDLTEDNRKGLEARIVWLPEPTRINVNTADRLVIMSALLQSDGKLTDEILARRERIPFRSIAELSAMVPAQVISEVGVFDVQSRYFRLQGYAQFGQAEAAFFTLFFRQGMQVFRMDEWLTD